MTTVDTLAGPLSEEELQLIDAYWRAANYLSVGQIYLMETGSRPKDRGGPIRCHLARSGPIRPICES